MGEAQDKYFMGVAAELSKLSPDPVLKVGAIIVNKENQIVGEGFNDMPRGSDNWEKKNVDEDKKKHWYVVHAETNAFIKRTSDVKNGRMYVTLHPCNKCAQIIVESGIKEVIFMSDKKRNRSCEEIVGKNILEKAHVITRQLTLKKYDDMIDDQDREDCPPV